MWINTKLGFCATYDHVKFCFNVALEVKAMHPPPPPIVLHMVFVEFLYLNYASLNTFQVKKTNNIFSWNSTIHNKFLMWIISLIIFFHTKHIQTILKRMFFLERIIQMHWFNFISATSIFMAVLWIENPLIIPVKMVAWSEMESNWKSCPILKRLHINDCVK